MEKRAGEVVEKVAGMSTQNAAKKALDGNAVRVEFSVYMYNYQLISKLKFLCNLCSGTWYLYRYIE